MRGTLGDSGWDHSCGVGGAGGRGTWEGGSGRLVTSSHGTGPSMQTGLEQKRHQVTTSKLTNNTNLQGNM